MTNEEVKVNLEAWIGQELEISQGPEAQTIDIPGPSCNQCHDRGWISYDVPVDDPLFGKSFPCSCARERFINQCRKQSGIMADDWGRTFDKFQRVDGTEEAYQAAWEIAQPKSELRLVLIYGTRGNGKTHLGIAVAIESINLGIAARVIRCQDWLEAIKRAIGQKDSVGADALKRGAEQVPVLIFDEMKRRTDTDEDWIDQLVTKRGSTGMKTLITTNYDWPELREEFSRIESRARAKSTGRLVLNDGIDQRGKLG